LNNNQPFLDNSLRHYIDFKRSENIVPQQILALYDKLYSIYKNQFIHKN